MDGCPGCARTGAGGADGGLGHVVGARGADTADRGHGAGAAGGHARAVDQGTPAQAGRAGLLPGPDRRPVCHRHPRGGLGVPGGAGAAGRGLRELRDGAGAERPARTPGARRRRGARPDRSQPVDRGPGAVPRQPDRADQPRLDRRPLLLLLPRRRLRLRRHADRQLQDRRLPARLGHRAARRDVQPGVLRRHRLRHPRRHVRAAGAGLARLHPDPDGHRGVLPHAGAGPRRARDRA